MSNAKKKKQLGMDPGTAFGRLKKAIMFELTKELGKNYCWRCETEIKSVDTFSIEHKTPWLDSDDPVHLFFNYENISYSHLSCNVSAARRSKKYKTDKERIKARRNRNKHYMRKVYTSEKRHQRYLDTGN